MASGSSAQAQERYLNQGGVDIIQVVGLGGSVQLALTASGGIQVAPIAIAVNGAINPFTPGVYVITAGGALTGLTLAAPVAGLDDGNIIEVFSATAFAHKITATGLLQTGTASVNSVTLPAFAGANVTFQAYQGKWMVSFPANGMNAGAAYAQNPTYLLA